MVGGGSEGGGGAILRTATGGQRFWTRQPKFSLRQIFLFFAKIDPCGFCSQGLQGFRGVHKVFSSVAKSWDQVQAFCNCRKPRPPSLLQTLDSLRVGGAASPFSPLPSVLLSQTLISATPTGKDSFDIFRSTLNPNQTHF